MHCDCLGALRGSLVDNWSQNKQEAGNDLFFISATVRVLWRGHRAEEFRMANHRHKTFAGQAGPFTVKELLSGLVCPKAKVLISQCSSRTPSFIRIMSVAITGRPTPENRLADAYVRFATKHSALIGLMFAAKH
jgi:hypothetical protein